VLALLARRVARLERVRPVQVAQQGARRAAAEQRVRAEVLQPTAQAAIAQAATVVLAVRA